MSCTNTDKYHVSMEQNYLDRDLDCNLDQETTNLDCDLDH